MSTEVRVKATVKRQRDLHFGKGVHPSALVKSLEPFHETEVGAAFLCDSERVLADMPDNSANLIFTSPPYALHFKKAYGNVEKHEYVEWFLRFAKEFKRVLTDDGSFVLNIGGSYNQGSPTRSIYHFKLLVALVEEVGFHLAQEAFWYNPAKMPMPAEWVTVRRVRIKDSVEYLWWFSKTTRPKANNRNVLRPYSADMIRLNKRGVLETIRPSGHSIKSGFTDISSGGSIPPNVIDDSDAESMLRLGNNSANDYYTKCCKQYGIKIHPARFPAALPEFFIKLLTDEGDLVYDPFAGSNTCGAVAERLGRRWLASENVEEYLIGSRYRFDEVAPLRGK